MGLQRMTLESQNAMNAVDGATIERRIRISRPDEGRGRCKGSRAWDPRKDFSQCMQQPIILSTSSTISPQQERTEPSGHRPCRHGVKSSLLREPDVPGDLLRAIFGNVTEPLVPLRWKRAKIHRGSRRQNIGPHHEAGYTSAVVTEPESVKAVAIGRGPYTSTYDLTDKDVDDASHVPMLLDQLTQD